MAPLIIISICFVLLLAVNKLFLKGKWSISFIGRVSLAIMLVFTGVAHFTRIEVMITMLPEFIPFKKETVYLTGFVEIIAACGLVVPTLSRLTSYLLIVYFLAVLPANIIGSLKQVDLGGMAKGEDYLYFRVPLQVFFILVTYYFGVKINKTQADAEGNKKKDPLNPRHLFDRGWCRIGH